MLRVSVVSAYCWVAWATSFAVACDPGQNTEQATNRGPAADTGAAEPDPNADARWWYQQESSLASDEDSLSIEPLQAGLASWIINHGTIWVLDDLLGPHEHWLYLRLVELPIDGTCYGSEAACRYRYLLTLVADLMGYDEPVFDLGAHYRLRPVAWLPVVAAATVLDSHLTARVLVDVWLTPDFVRPSTEEVIDLSPEAAQRFELVVTDQTITVHRH